MASTPPTFVEVIEDIRGLKSRLQSAGSEIGAIRALARNSAERQIADGLKKITENVSSQLQDISIKVSSLAVNYSKEDLEQIMKAMSK